MSTPLVKAYADLINWHTTELHLDGSPVPLRYQWSSRLPMWGRVWHRWDKTSGMVTHNSVIIKAGLTPTCIKWTLAHEMRHVWQTVNGLLTFCGGSRRYRRWFGMKVDLFEGLYHDLPWEIDANNYAAWAIGVAPRPTLEATNEQ